MPANVLLTDTFETWRSRTNSLLNYTQAGGGAEALKLTIATDAASNTTGSIITAGGISTRKSVVVGENLEIQGNSVFAGDTTIGNATDDELTITASLDSDIIPKTDATSATLGSATKRYGALYVNGVVGDTTTGSIQIPSGTTAQRVGETGAIRFNSDLTRFEGNTGTNFASLAATPQDLDGDTKITVENATDEDMIRFFTGVSGTATQRVNIAGGASGNVGIGTGATAGDAKLQVTGTANISGTLTLGDVLTAGGNVTATGAFVNLQSTADITLGAPTTTISSDNTIITGNLVVSGTRTYVDTTTMTSRDKTLVLGAGSQTFSNSAYTAANPTVITSKVENVATAHSLNTNDKIVVLRSDDTTNIPQEAIYTITKTGTNTFTIPIDMSSQSAGTLDFAGPQTDALIDDAGLIIPGTTVHKLTWDDTGDAWHFTDSAVIAGDLTITGNDIKNSDGEVTITMDTDKDITAAANVDVTSALNVTGIAKFNGGVTIEDGDTFTFDATAFTVANQFTLQDSSGGTIFSGYMLNA